MRAGVIWTNQPDSRDYYSLFDEVCGSVGIGWYVKEDWDYMRRHYQGAHPQKHWLTYNSQMVPGEVGTWQWHINPVGVGRPYSRSSRLPAPYEHLYDITNPEYRARLITRAISNAEDTSRDYGAYFTGIFFDSICSEWWWGPKPAGFDLAAYRQGQADLCAEAAIECHKHRLEVGANVAVATAEWPGSLDFMWLEHCKLDTPIPEFLMQTRTCRVGVNIELVDQNTCHTSYDEQFRILVEKYEPFIAENDCIMVNDCDPHREAMERLMTAYIQGRAR